MNPATRKRLSQLLAELDKAMPIDPCGDERPQQLLDQARAITDNPPTPTHIHINTRTLNTPGRQS